MSGPADRCDAIDAKGCVILQRVRVPGKGHEDCVGDFYDEVLFIVCGNTRVSPCKREYR